MPSVEELLENVLNSSDESGDVVPGAAASASAEGGEGLDVADFVDHLGKTAEALEKAAERLPTSPSLASKQLRALSSPMGVTREELHGQHREFVGQVLPQARGSLRVPTSLEGIQKGAEGPDKSKSWLLSQLGR